MLLVLLDIVRSIFLYFYWGWLSIHWARDRLMLQHVARASQTFWICAIYTNLHLLDNCTVIFYSASLHILKWRYQTFCFWLLIIYHPLKVPGFPISRFSPVPDDKHVHVVNHAAKNLSHRKKKAAFKPLNGRSLPPETAPSTCPVIPYIWIWKLWLSSVWDINTKIYAFQRKSTLLMRLQH